jgi:PIN domain nuclease of toxin-antitoxin system
VRLLLDSHVVLWLTVDVPGRSSAKLDAIVDGANETLVSAVTVWELEVKRVKGHALDAARLPPHHRDPFDRLLVAQAQGEAATLVTADEALAAYDVPIMPVTS